MKTSILFLFLVISSQVWSQDLIVKINGEEIQAKIIEVNPTEIKFKKYNYLDGPFYTELKSEIFYIKYANGVKEIISNLETKEPPKIFVPYPGATPLAQISIESDGYYQNGFKLSRNKLYWLFRGSPDMETKRNGINALHMEMHSRPLIALSIPLISVGLAVTVFSSNLGVSSGSMAGLAGVGMMVLGGGCLTTGIVLTNQSGKKLKSAVASYNQLIK